MGKPGQVTGADVAGRGQRLWRAYEGRRQPGRHRADAVRPGPGPRLASPGLAWPGAEHARLRGTASGEGWEKHRLDTRTICSTRRGRFGVDTDWMRPELDMADEAESVRRSRARSLASDSPETC
jgi:hypothetical protein